MKIESLPGCDQRYISTTRLPGGLSRTGRNRAFAALLFAAALVVTMLGPLASSLGAADYPTDAMFNETCARCHGTQGFGDGPDGQTLATKPRNFHDCELMARDSDDTVLHEIKGGSASIGRSNDMPSWGEALTDDEIRSLVAYVRHFCAEKSGK